MTHERGATLIEVMITVLILATGLLTMAALQSRSLQFNQSAFIRSQANIYAYDIIDRIRLNRGANAVNVSTYTTSSYVAAPVGNAVAVNDVSEWRTNLQRLPEGQGKIECVAATRVCTVYIKWAEKQLFDAADPDASVEFIYSSGI